ncbi:MAG: 30S ribosome-binding factor RbfA [Vulcanimicrobiaceae bacterium]
MKPERRGRIDHEIQRALAKIIAEEIKDPRLGFVTVTRAEITGDMQHCKVFVSIIGDRHVARQSMDVLESAKGFIRGRLGDEIDLRFTPELNFVEDRTTERAIALTHKVDEAAAVSAAKVDE